MNLNKANRKLIKKAYEEKLNKYENFNDEDSFGGNFFDNFNTGGCDYDEIRAEVLKEIKEKSKKRNRRIATGLLMITALTTGGYILKDYSKSKINAGYDNLAVEKFETNNSSNKSGNGDIITKEKEGKEDDENSDNSSLKENMTTEQVVKKVSSAVVTITVSTQGSYGMDGKQGLGTGFIVDKDGTVITNYHVIENASNIKITLHDGTEVDCEVIITSKKDDLAMLRITDKIEMPGVVILGEDDDVNAGEDVVAIGNPLGKEFSGSVSKGIISATRRFIKMDGYQREFIQTDTAINPGNSGGPLISLKGEIIGVNSAKKSGENVEGMGFAIPIKYVRAMIENPEDYTNEHSEYSNYSGGYGEDYYGNNGGSFGGNYGGNYDGNFGGNYDEYNSGVTLGITVIEKSEGILVVEVNSGNLGEKFGLKERDLITGVNGVDIKTVDELKSILATLNYGNGLILNVIRNGISMELSILM